MSGPTHKDLAILRFIRDSRMAAAAPDTQITHRLMSGALGRYLQEAEDRQEDIDDWLWELIGFLCFQADQILLPDQKLGASLTFLNPSGDHLDPEEMSSRDPVLAGLVNAGRLLTAFHNDDPETCGAIVSAILSTDDSTVRLSATVAELAVMPYRVAGNPSRQPWFRALIPGPLWVQAMRRRRWLS